MSKQILKELDGFKKEYDVPRRTLIENSEEAVFEEKKFEEMDVVFLMDRFGYAKTVDVPTYERNKEAADSENKYIIKCKNTGKILLFTDTGFVHSIRTRDLPMGRFRYKGTPVDNVSNFDSSKEIIVLAADLEEVSFGKLLFVTKQGMMKHVYGTEFDVAKRTVASTKLNDDDMVVSVEIIKDQHNVILKSHDGYFLRFPVDEVPEKKKAAVGVRGIKLSGKDYVENVFFTSYTDDTVVEISGKKLALNKVKLQKRDSKGVKVKL